MIVESGYDKNKNLVAISLVNELLLSNEKPVFLCVGSDKVVGDCLGVFVGELLKKKYKINGFIYGDFNVNINANNLKEIVQEIKKKHPNSPIVLVDAILGDIEEVGQVKFYRSGAIPGGEFNKGELVGDYSILAVVGAKGINALNFVKSVRLNLVVNLAEFIAESISRAYKFAQNLI